MTDGDRGRETVNVLPGQSNVIDRQSGSGRLTAAPDFLPAARASVATCAPAVWPLLTHATVSAVGEWVDIRDEAPQGGVQRNYTSYISCFF